MIQFKHEVDSGVCIAVEAPSREQLVSSRDNMEKSGLCDAFTIKMGLALLNPSDKYYVKKIAREVAGQNLRDVAASLVEIRTIAGVIYPVLKVKTGGRVFHLRFKLSPGRDRPHLIELL